MVRPLNATKRTFPFARLKSAFAPKRTFTTLDATTRESRLLAAASRARSRRFGYTVQPDRECNEFHHKLRTWSPTLNGLLTSSAYLNGDGAIRIA